jgi:hypothetical protein
MVTKIEWKQAVVQKKDSTIDMNRASQDLDRSYVHVGSLQLVPVFQAASSAPLRLRQGTYRDMIGLADEAMVLSKHSAEFVVRVVTSETIQPQNKSTAYATSRASKAGELCIGAHCVDPWSSVGSVQLAVW